MPEPEPELMTYGQLVKAYVAVREERHRLRADDLAIRRILRDYGASVGDADPLPAIVAETLDAARKTGAELVELRYRHEQVCQELAEARRGCERIRAERDRLRRRLGDVLDMDGPCICPGDPDHDPHPTPCGAPNSGTGHGPWCEPCNNARLQRINAGFAEIRATLAGSTPDTGSTP